MSAAIRPATSMVDVDGGRCVPHTLQLFAADESGAIDHVLVYRDDRLFALFEELSSPER